MGNKPSGLSASSGGASASAGGASAGGASVGAASDTPRPSNIEASLTSLNDLMTQAEIALAQAAQAKNSRLQTAPEKAALAKMKVRTMINDYVAVIVRLINIITTVPYTLTTYDEIAALEPELEKFHKGYINAFGAVLAQTELTAAPGSNIASLQKPINQKAADVDKLVLAVRQLFKWAKGETYKIKKADAAEKARIEHMLSMMISNLRMVEFKERLERLRSMGGGRRRSHSRRSRKAHKKAKRTSRKAHKKAHKGKKRNAVAA
jgi:hypothetical protein